MKLQQFIGHMILQVDHMTQSQDGHMILHDGHMILHDGHMILHDGHMILHDDPQSHDAYILTQLDTHPPMYLLFTLKHEHSSEVREGKSHRSTRNAVGVIQHTQPLSSHLD